MQELGLQKQITFVVGADLVKIKYLYEHCRALIHPSLAEGFGLPIIEAMYFQKPIIASDILPFKELAKNQYLAFFPHDEKALLDQIKRLLDQKINQVDYGNFETEFNFEKMTQTTLGVYQNCLK